MSAFVLPPGYIHVTETLKETTVARPMMFTFAAQIQTPPFTLSNAGTLMDDVHAALQPLYDSSWTHPDQVVLVGQDGPPLRFVTHTTSTGTRATQDEPPPNVAILLQKATQLSGRRYRGRCYLPASNEGVIDPNGHVQGSEVTLFQTAASAILTACLVAGGNNLSNMVILHSQAPTTPTTVLSLDVSSTVATQRPRLVR